MDSANNVYVADPQLGRVLKYDSAGSFLSVAATLAGVRDIDVDSAGNIYAGTGSSVSKLSPAGVPLWAVVVDETELVVSGGTLWIARSSRTQIEGRSTADGSVSVPAWTLSGRTVDDLTVAPSGNLVIANNRTDSGASEYSPAGSLIRDIQTYGQVTPSQEEVIDTDSAFDLYASPNPQPHSAVFRYTSNGVPKGEGIVPGQWVRDIEVGSNGIVWITKDADHPEPNAAIRLLRVDPEVPVPIFSASGFYSEEPTELDAGPSYGTLGSIARYEWDLDGDGTFETDAGSQERFTTVFPPGNIPVSLRVTGDTGKTAVQEGGLLLYRRPPPGQVGISINNGALYTNDPQVSISLVWPDPSSDALVSNDGGFGGSGTFQVASQIPWTLDSAGPDRLPRTVYVRFRDRFNSAGFEPPTYQDDIILDTIAPVIDVVTIGGGGSAAAAQGARASGAKTYGVRVDANDNASGVSEVQYFTPGIGGPSEWQPYESKLRVRAKRSRVSVRVKDGAGNVSDWRHAKKKKKKKRPRKR